MRRILAGLAAAAFVLALGAPAFAKTETVKGQIVDQACYKMGKSNTGKDHKMPKGDTTDCASACTKEGRPLAILASDREGDEIAGGLSGEQNGKRNPHTARSGE